VFADRLEPRHDPSVRAAEIELAHHSAGRIGLPLIVAETNLKAFSDPIVVDWEDMIGGALACVAHALAGEAGEATISAAHSYAVVDACGSSPLLDPMFSTERVRIRHSSKAYDRAAKIRWLVEQRPDLVPELKVCYSANRSDNCCRCQKCLYTMACLHVCGGLDAAPQFPEPLDNAAVADLRFPVLRQRVEWGVLATVDDDRSGGALRDAVRAALRASVGYPVEETSFGRQWLVDTQSLLFTGEPRDPVRARD
jgi:hypothetical protein